MLWGGHTKQRQYESPGQDVSYDFTPRAVKPVRCLGGRLHIAGGTSFPVVNVGFVDTYFIYSLCIPVIVALTTVSCLLRCVLSPDSPVHCRTYGQ